MLGVGQASKVRAPMVRTPHLHLTGGGVVLMGNTLPWSRRISSLIPDAATMTSLRMAIAASSRESSLVAWRWSCADTQCNDCSIRLTLPLRSMYTRYCVGSNTRGQETLL